jgi:hypothetical protein
MAGHWLAAYWHWAGSNIGAEPACGLIALAVGGPVVYLLRDRIGKHLAGWWHRHLGHRGELAEMRDLAERALVIAAATHRHVTGREHPQAPKEAP